MKEEEKKEIIFIYSDGGCNEAESYAQTQISNVVAGSNQADFAGTAKHAIKGTGQKATNNDGNKSIGGGGLYSKECLATSFRNPQFNGCFVKVGRACTDMRIDTCIDTTHKDNILVMATYWLWHRHLQRYEQRPHSSYGHILGMA